MAAPREPCSPHPLDQKLQRAQGAGLWSQKQWRGKPQQSEAGPRISTRALLFRTRVLKCVTRVTSAPPRGASPNSFQVVIVLGHIVSQDPE